VYFSEKKKKLELLSCT